MLTNILIKEPTFHSSFSIQIIHGLSLIHRDQKEYRIQHHYYVLEILVPLSLMAGQDLTNNMRFLSEIISRLVSQPNNHQHSFATEGLSFPEPLFAVPKSYRTVHAHLRKWNSSRRMFTSKVTKMPFIDMERLSQIVSLSYQHFLAMFQALCLT